ncbi:MAG: DUF711 family protein [Clostridiales bacterium]|nr:MAG: DUF711 family protein [Clostridiales bacterium]
MLKSQKLSTRRRTLWASTLSAVFRRWFTRAFTVGDTSLIYAIPEALSETELVCSSVNVGSTKAGINMDAVKKMGEVIKETAKLTKDSDGFGCAKLVVFANAVEDNPFMAGAFHGAGEAGMCDKRRSKRSGRCKMRA